MEKNGMGGKMIFQCFCVLLQNFAGECKTGDGESYEVDRKTVLQMNHSKFFTG